ncbi:MAG: hypothetical protein PVF20_01980 [Desulfobacterales bacterium]
MRYHESEPTPSLGNVQPPDPSPNGQGIATEAIDEKDEAVTPPIDDISDLIFKRSVSAQDGEVTLDAPALRTLLTLDGKTPLGDIASRLNMDMARMRQIMTRLAKLKLVVRVAIAQSVLSQPFVSYIKAELAKAMGPIAATLLDDVLDDMGLAVGGIPKTKGAELVDLLAQEIPDNQRRIAFIKAMLPKLQ